MKVLGQRLAEKVHLEHRRLMEVDRHLLLVELRVIIVATSLKTDRGSTMSPPMTWETVVRYDELHDNFNEYAMPISAIHLASTPNSSKHLGVSLLLPLFSLFSLDLDILQRLQYTPIAWHIL